MKPKKEVYMQCPNCKAKFSAEPIIVVEKDGGTHVGHELRRACMYCGTGLQRRVKK